MTEHHAGELTVDITAKITKITANVELHADGRCVGTTTVDLTPLDAATDAKTQLEHALRQTH